MYCKEFLKLKTVTETVYNGQVTLSTQFLEQNDLVIPPPPPPNHLSTTVSLGTYPPPTQPSQHHSFFRNLPPSPPNHLSTTVETETLPNHFSLTLCYNDLITLVRLTADYGKASYFKFFQSHM